MRENGLKVLMVTGDFPPQMKGIGDYAFHVSRSLSKLGASVKVVTTRIEDFSINYTDADNIDIRRIILGWGMSEASKIVKSIEGAGEGTIANIQYYCPATYGRKPMINLLPFILRTYRPKCRVILTMHGFWEQSALFRLRTLPMLRGSHGIIYVDRQNMNLLRKYSGVKPDKLKFIPIASNILPVSCTPLLRQEWRKRLGFNQADIVVAFFGAIGRPKGFIHLIKAMEYLRRNQKLPLTLLAIGGFHSYGENDEYQKNIQRIIRQPEMKSWIHVIQEPDPVECSKYFHSSDLAVFPFIRGVAENSGSTLAALSHGLPTIVTEGPSDSRRFFDRLGVPLVPPENSIALAECMLSIIQSKEKQALMKANALNLNLTWENIAKQTLEFYTSLLQLESISERGNVFEKIEY